MKYYLKCSLPPRVAIVRGGLPDLIFATDLLRIDVKDITFFYSLDAIRDNTTLPLPYAQDLHLIVTFNFMFFSINQTCLSHYVNKFRIATEASFPIVGKVNIVLYCCNKRHSWPVGQVPQLLF